MHQHLTRIVLLAVMLMMIGCSGGGIPTTPSGNNSPAKPSDELTSNTPLRTEAGQEPAQIIGNFTYVTDDEETLAWGTIFKTEDGWDYRIDYLAPRIRAMQKSDVYRNAQCVIDLTWLKLISVGVQYVNKPTTPPELPKYEQGEYMKYRLNIKNNIPFPLNKQTVVATQVDMFNNPLGADAKDTWNNVNIPVAGTSLDADWTVEPTLVNGIYYTKVRVSFKGPMGVLTFVIFDAKAGAYKVEKGVGPQYFDPVAKGVTTTPEVGVGENVHVQDNGSFDPDGGSIVKYEWDIDNNGTFDYVGPSADYSYSAPGLYYVNLRVTDDEGATDDLTDDPGDALIKIVVTPPPVPPVAAAKASAYEVFVNEAITFDGSDSYDPDGGSIVLYEWDWDGDGTYDETGKILNHAYASPGTYYVQLKVTDDEMQTDTLDKPLEIVVKPTPTHPPTACAEWESEIGPYPCTIILFDASCSSDPGNDIVKYEWDIDNDGEWDFTLTEPKLNASYQTVGKYQVQLRVTDSLGYSDMLDEPLEVEVINALPTAVGTADDNDVYVGQNVKFDGFSSYDNDCNGNKIVTWEWDLDGNGTYDKEGAYIDHAYDAEGIYYVQLLVTDDEGGTDVLDEPIVIKVSIEKLPPIAKAKANPVVQTVCENVNLYDDGSYDPDGGLIVKYEWDWDNDGTYDAEGSNINYAWTVPGIYYVQFRVTDDEGQTATLAEPIKITIENALPTAVASADAYDVFEGQTINFDGTGSYDNDCDGQHITKWEWDWNNDGTYDAQGAKAAHAYMTKGVYYVQLRVTDNEGGTDVLDNPLTINVAGFDPPVAYAKAAPNPQVVCGIVEFSDDGSFDPDGGLIVKYEWDWNNDGVYDEVGMNANYSWTVPGTYYVQFRVTDDDGQMDTLDTPLEIKIQNALPTAVGKANKYNAYVGDLIGFSGLDSYDNDCGGQSIVKWEWDWTNDGIFDEEGATAAHAYGATGIYYVQLRVTDNEGGTDTLDVPLQISITLPPCPGGLHSTFKNRGCVGYSTRAYSIMPRADIAFIESGWMAGRTIVQGGSNSLLVFDSNVDDMDPIDDLVSFLPTGGKKGEILVTNLDSSPMDGLIADVTSDRPHELKLLDTEVIFGDKVVFRYSFGENAKIMAMDFEADGDIWLVVKGAPTSGNIFLWYGKYVGAPVYFNNWKYKSIGGIVGIETDIFDIAMLYNKNALCVFDAGTDNRGRITMFDVSNPASPVVLVTATSLFGSTINYTYSADYGIAGFADIEVDHRDSNKEDCRIVVFARTSMGLTQIIKYDSNLNVIISTLNPGGTWPSMTIDNHFWPDKRRLVMPGESKLAFWDVPFDW